MAIQELNLATGEKQDAIKRETDKITTMFEKLEAAERGYGVLASWKGRSFGVNIGNDTSSRTGRLVTAVNVTGRGLLYKAEIKGGQYDAGTDRISAAVITIDGVKVVNILNSNGSVNYTFNAFNPTAFTNKSFEHTQIQSNKSNRTDIDYVVGAVAPIYFDKSIKIEYANTYYQNGVVHVGGVLF